MGRAALDASGSHLWDVNLHDQSMVINGSFFRQLGYSGPRALPGHGPHCYVLQLFALGERSGLAHGAGRGELVAALKGKLLARGTLEGTFERP